MKCACSNGHVTCVPFCLQSKVASAGLASLAALMADLPAHTRRAHIVPAMRPFWPPNTATLSPELQLGLAQQFGTILCGLAPSLESEQDMASFLACFR